MVDNQLTKSSPLRSPPNSVISTSNPLSQRLSSKETCAGWYDDLRSPVHDNSLHPQIQAHHEKELGFVQRASICLLNSSIPSSICCWSTVASWPLENRSTRWISSPSAYANPRIAKSPRDSFESEPCSNINWRKSTCKQKMKDKWLKGAKEARNAASQSQRERERKKELLNGSV